jgi:aspartate carbamoyltransferase catalytic subunit
MARSILTIDDLSNEEIEAIFELADDFLTELGTPGRPYRIQGRKDVAGQFILSTLFFEPSTRTRFSFESAMLRLGGNILSSANPTSTSASKGESLADTVRVIENYADLIVIRHPREGAARVASEYTDIPVINAGDGGHEHPTQTLCDLYTLRRENKSLKDLNVLLCGDLKHGRTIHSLVYALARFGARIMPLAGKGLDLPEHVRNRLKREYGCIPRELPSNGFPVDVVYQTPEKDHQLALIPDVDLDLRMKFAKPLGSIDVCYVTRLQVERMGDEASKKDYPIVDRQFLNEHRYKHSSVLHPLPRVDELGYDMDADSRGVYFKQASYGVPVRMALLAALMKLYPNIVTAQNRERPYPIYTSVDGIRCGNNQCITNDPQEKRYLKPKFWIVDETALLRCTYCEHELHPQAVGSTSAKKFDTNLGRWATIDAGHLVFFEREVDAHRGGFQPYKGKPKQTAGTPVHR